MINRHPSRVVSFSSPFIVWSTLGAGTPAPIPPAPTTSRAVLSLQQPFAIWSNLFRSSSAPPAGPPLIVYIDPRQAQLVSSGSDADPFGIEPRAAQLMR